MARRNASPRQIIRKDGNNCFVEALTDAFEIGKMHLKFVTYDQSRSQGNKFTNEIDIYIDLNVALRICYDALDSGTLIKTIMTEKAAAQEKTRQTGQKVYAKQTIIHQGGTSETALAKAGKSRQDGKAIARVLKVFAGDKLPVMFKAETGPGESDKNGLIIPKYGYKPESYVQIGMSADSFKEFFLSIRTSIESYFTLNLYDQKHEAKIRELEIKTDAVMGMLKLIAGKMGLQNQAQQILHAMDSKLEDMKPKYGNNNRQTQNNIQQGNRYQQNNGSNNQYTPQNSYQQNIPPSYSFDDYLAQFQTADLPFV